jgi:hypothetical protein
MKKPDNAGQVSSWRYKKKVRRLDTVLRWCLCEMAAGHVRYCLTGAWRGGVMDFMSDKLHGGQMFYFTMGAFGTIPCRRFILLPRMVSRSYGMSGALLLVGLLAASLAPAALSLGTQDPADRGRNESTFETGAGKLEPETILASSEDAYICQQRTNTGVRWRFGTGQVEKQVQFEGAHLVLSSFLDRAAHREYVQAPSDLLAFTWNGRTVTGRSESWLLDRVTTLKLSQGELLLKLAIHDAQVAVVKSYLLYPQESIIQEWLEVTNRSGQVATLVDPEVLTIDLLQRESSNLDFTYWNTTISSMQPTTEPLEKSHVFDSYATFEYAPLQIYENRTTKSGFFVGWDYTGLWRSNIAVGDGRPVHVDFQVAHYRRNLKPRESVETPKALTGVFHGDFDELGHQLLDYQYRYKWDYTRSPYFPSVALEGYWARGGQWGDGADPMSNYRKVFRQADMMRSIGADDFWRDHGWWDIQGEWNGPNWGETRRYLAKYGMLQTIYLPVETAAPDSKVARDHPEWIASERKGEPNEGVFFDQSQPAVLAWELKMLDSRQKLWGDFEWRKDWVATTFMRDSTGGLDSDTSSIYGLHAPVLGFLRNSTGGLDTTRLLAQDQGFRHLVQTFLDQHPGMAFHGCAGGGTDIGYDMLRLGVAWQLADGKTDPTGAYYASYLFPPDKLNNIPDFYSLELYDQESWRGLLWNRMSMTSETDDPAKLEGIRQLIDINHYLVQMGVYGRWGFVYHPAITGDKSEWYLQRMNVDNRRGVIIPWHAQKAGVTIYPKGLLPDLSYDVSFQVSDTMMQRLGADLMRNGISFPSVPDGEIIYLNLPLHPGSRVDHTPPTAPTEVAQDIATQMDYSGVELHWQPGHDDNWVSYYLIYRNGHLIDKVAKGTYYFDHALGADLAARYAVATVDASGNRSDIVSARSVAPQADLVVDDASPALKYRGDGWLHEIGQWGAANGTQARTRTAGDSLTYTFTGNQVTWYGRMGRDKGVAAVYLDGRLDRLVNTYNADEFPNIALYSRTFPGMENHTLEIKATGIQQDNVVLTRWPGRAANAPQGDNELEARQERGWIVIDGIQVDQTPEQVEPTSLHSRIQYRGSWSRSTTSIPANSERRELSESGTRSIRAEDTATYTFEGSGITWVGTRCSRCGMADVYLDGRLATTVDTYTRPVLANAMQGDEQHNVPLFTQHWTRRGRHDLRLVVRPDANVWAKGHAVYLNALHVTP